MNIKEDLISRKNKKYNKNFKRISNGVKELSI